MFCQIFSPDGFKADGYSESSSCYVRRTYGQVDTPRDLFCVILPSILVEMGVFVGKARNDAKQ